LFTGLTARAEREDRASASPVVAERASIDNGKS
jgi:hypothetical protein